MGVHVVGPCYRCHQTCIITDYGGVTGRGCCARCAMADVVDLMGIPADAAWGDRPAPPKCSIVRQCGRCGFKHDRQYEDLVAIGIDEPMARRMSETAGFHPPC